VVSLKDINKYLKQGFKTKTNTRLKKEKIKKRLPFKYYNLVDAFSKKAFNMLSLYMKHNYRIKLKKRSLKKLRGVYLRPIN
jgi:hypothetical protein